jgi:hypothetical protein
MKGENRVPDVPLIVPRDGSLQTGSGAIRKKNHWKGLFLGNRSRVPISTYPDKPETYFKIKIEQDIKDV